VNYGRLIAGLNKYWQKLSPYEFWYKMDIESTQNAIGVSCFPKEVEEWIFVKKRNPFEVF
jgi:hypothetical protein